MKIFTKYKKGQVVKFRPSKTNEFEDVRCGNHVTGEKIGKIENIIFRVYRFDCHFGIRDEDGVYYETWDNEIETNNN